MKLNIYCSVLLLLLLALASEGGCDGASSSEDNHHFPTPDKPQRPSDNQQVADRLDALERLVLAQDDKLRGYEVKLGDQEQLLQEQSEKLLEQEARIALLERELGRNGEQEPTVILADSGVTNSGDGNAKLPMKTVVNPISNVRNKLSKLVSNSSPQQDISDFNDHRHDMTARSDDPSPLEAVVSQLSQHVTRMDADLQTLTTKNSQQDLNIQDARTSTFVHWGSSQCGSSVQTVYSGVVGGGAHSETGAATNYLCLTMTPVLLTLPSGPAAELHGTEYHSGYPNGTPDAVCSVCRTGYSSTIMIPGTNVCTPGWHLEYSGYLMAGRTDHAAGSEYICVDSKLETFPHTESAQIGNLLYYTLTRCSSLLCSPYVDNKVVTCAVCSM